MGSWPRDLFLGRYSIGVLCIELIEFGVGGGGFSGGIGSFCEMSAI